MKHQELQSNAAVLQDNVQHLELEHHKLVSVLVSVLVTARCCDALAKH